MNGFCISSCHLSILLWQYYAPQPLCVLRHYVWRQVHFMRPKICARAVLYTMSLSIVMMMTLRLCRYSLRMAKFVLIPPCTTQCTFHDLLLRTKRQHWMASWQRTDSIERWITGQCYWQIQLQLQLSAKLLVQPDDTQRSGQWQWAIPLQKFSFQAKILRQSYRTW